MRRFREDVAMASWEGGGIFGGDVTDVRKWNRKRKDRKVSVGYDVKVVM